MDKKNVKEKNKSILERLFKLSENGTNAKTEILAGITTFITVAYIIFVNPNILRFAGMNLQNIKGDEAAVFTVLNDPIVASVFAATCISAALGTLIMAFYANLPFVLAPGMGLNAFFTFSVCINLGYSWQQGLAAVFISGIVFVIITLTSIREKIVNALPHNLKLAISGGIGLFVSLIGLKSGGIIVSNPETLLSFSSFNNSRVLLTVIGITLTAILMSRKVKGAMLIGIVVTTIIGIPLGISNISGVKILSTPPSIMPTLMHLDFKGLLGYGGTGVIGAISSVLMVIITFSLVDLFDTIGALVGTAQKANMLEPDGKVKNMNQAMLSDALATVFGAMLGTSTLVTSVESTAGISEGGRTGLTSFTVSVLFILSMFFSGIVGIVPPEATAPALVIVGVLMLGAVKEINFDDFTEALPAFFTIAIMPFSYSIANGISVGIIFYPIVKVATGKHKEVHPIIYILAVLFILRFILLPH